MPKSAKASLRLGVYMKRTSPYVSGGTGDPWDKNNRKHYKAELWAGTNGIATVVPKAFRDLWLEFVIVVDDDGFYSDEATYTTIEAQLVAFNNGSGNGLNLRMENQADHLPDSISYVYVNNTRYCLHRYKLEIDSGAGYGDWNIADGPGGAKQDQSAQVFAELSWPTDDLPEP